MTLCMVYKRSSFRTKRNNNNFFIFIFCGSLCTVSIAISYGAATNADKKCVHEKEDEKKAVHEII